MPFTTDGRALVKLLPAELLTKAREEKAAAQREKAERQAASQAAAEAKRIQKLEKGKVPPSDLFRQPQTSDFSQWDADGLPTHDKDGQEISKAKRKKCVKEWDAQKKLHEEYTKWKSSQ